MNLDRRDLATALALLACSLVLGWLWQRYAGASLPAGFVIAVLLALLMLRTFPGSSLGPSSSTHVEHPFAIGACAGLTVGMIVGMVTQRPWLPLLPCIALGLAMTLAIAWDQPHREVARSRLRAGQRWAVILMFLGILLYILFPYVRSLF